MSYDIFFVRRDPGQTFEDALDDLESSLGDGGDPELTDSDLEHWDELTGAAREILGDLEVADEDDTTRELTARATGIELILLRGEIEIHVPSDRPGDDELDLMSTVYELARAVEDVTGLEGYDPQLGEPVSDAANDDSPTRRHWPDDPVDDDEEGGSTARRQGTAGAGAVGDPHPELAPDRPQPRRWWEFWRS